MSELGWIGALLLALSYRPRRKQNLCPCCRRPLKGK